MVEDIRMSLVTFVLFGTRIQSESPKEIETAGVGLLEGRIADIKHLVIPQDSRNHDEDAIKLSTT